MLAWSEEPGNDFIVHSLWALQDPSDDKGLERSHEILAVFTVVLVSCGKD